MMKHTKGEWEVGYHSTDDKRDGAIVFEKETQVNICSLWATLRSVEECDANARLISLFLYSSKR